MAGRKKKTEESGPGQGWMVTFSDCMTLLLCFFVLLLSFSSFDEAKFETLAGAFQSMSYDWIEENPDRPKESLVERMEPKDMPRKGSIVPTDQPDHDQPPQPPVRMLDLDLYKDKTVFYLPSRRFFWAQGISMTRQGKDYLHSLAGLFRKMPCRVVIAETSGLVNRSQGLRRAWAIMRYFTQTEKMDPKQFTITAQHGRTSRFGGQGVLEITLMNVRIEE